MTKYHSFTHVEKLDKPDCEGILDGYIYVSPKLDGTNSCVWYDQETGLFEAGSRTRSLTEDKDNAGFRNWFLNTDYVDNPEPLLLKKALVDNTNWIIYGEWLGTNKCIGHIKDYNADALGKFWIFDVYDTKKNQYVPDYVWRVIFENEDYNLSEYMVPIIAQGEGFTKEKLMEIAENNKFLLDNANHPGEGIVIRQPGFRNKYGHYVIGKIVLEEYIQKKKEKKPMITPGEVEKSIIDLYLDDAFLSKNKAKVCITCDADEFDIKNGKMIGMFLNISYKDLVEENIFEIITKKFKNATIDFNCLRSLCSKKCRDYLGL